MCNLSGYVGSERAAPILIEMARKQEGFAGGFYTGIATISDGTIHCAKVVGDLSVLLQSTDAADFPGSVGILHSRTRSGGGREWAQPFVSSSGRLAYMSHGDVGAFRSLWDGSDVAVELFGKGVHFTSREPGSRGNYEMALPDGSVVHGSEVMCHLIEDAGTADLSQDLSHACSRFPAEIAGAMVHIDAPDRLFASRINKPLVVGIGRHGACLATTSMALPEACRSLREIEPNASVAIGAFGVETRRIEPEPGFVSELPDAETTDELVLRLLSSEKGRHFGAIKRGLQKELPGDGLRQDDASVYGALERLSRAGRVYRKEIRLPGVLEGLTAPKSVFFRAAD